MPHLHTAQWVSVVPSLLVSPVAIERGTSDRADVRLAQLSPPAPQARPPASRRVVLSVPLHSSKHSSVLTQVRVGATAAIAQPTQDNESVRLGG